MNNLRKQGLGDLCGLDYTASEEECPICFDLMTSGKGTVIYKTGCCKQSFHYSCIIDHVETGEGGSECPLCRQTLDVVPEEDWVYISNVEKESLSNEYNRWPQMNGEARSIPSEEGVGGGEGGRGDRGRGAEKQWYHVDWQTITWISTIIIAIALLRRSSRA